MRESTGLTRGAALDAGYGAGANAPRFGALRDTLETYLRSAVMAMTNPARIGASRFTVSLTRVLALAAVLVIAVLGLTFAPSSGSASAAQSIMQCNGVENTGGLGLNCDVSVINNLNTTTGVTSSVVTVEECQQAANTAPICTAPVTTSYDSLTTSVDQCNEAANGGGASVVCSVSVTNNITGAASNTLTEATVNQCNGSGAEGTQPTLDCNPFPANTTGATITQCNGSVNGGGAAERVICSVTPSTMSAQLPVSINQCNGTANGGGSLVTCTASLTNIVLASSTTPIPTATPVEAAPIATATPVAKNTLHDSKTDGFTHVSTTGDTSSILIVVGLVMLAGLLAAAVAVRRIGARR